MQEQAKNEKDIHTTQLPTETTLVSGNITSSLTLTLVSSKSIFYVT